MKGVSLLQKLVREGRITPRQGALLIELRREIAWRRRPWWERAWERAGTFLMQVLFR